MNCPKCGAKRIVEIGWDGYELFECFSFVYKAGQPLRESDQCLRNQLATVTAERDAARAAAERGWDALDCIKAGRVITSDDAHFFWNVRDDIRAMLNGITRQRTERTDDMGDC